MSMYHLITRIYPRGRRLRPTYTKYHERPMTDYIHAPWYMKSWKNLNEWKN